VNGAWEGTPNSIRIWSKEMELEIGNGIYWFYNSIKNKVSYNFTILTNLLLLLSVIWIW
jgi:hypothetical protein